MPIPLHLPVSTFERYAAAAADRLAVSAYLPYEQECAVHEIDTATA